MDVALAIRQRLEELKLEQRDLAKAAQVTESYISQLLTGRRLPPAPNRTDIYDKMDRLLKLPRGELAKLAAHQRAEQIKRELGDSAVPLFAEVRALILRKCHPAREAAVRAAFERSPFGELERLVTRTVLDVVKRVARSQLENELWLRTVAKLSGRSYREMRVVALDFLDTDLLNLSPDNCVVFLDPIIEAWDIDLSTFAMEIALHPELSPGPARRFEFVERPAGLPLEREPGFQEFLDDRTLSGSATETELAFLESLRMPSGRPTALYYYRELQNLRDPLHLRPDPGAGRTDR